MKFNPFDKSNRRYIKTCKSLKLFLLNEIHNMRWLEISKRYDLSTTVEEISIRDGAINELWEIVCLIAEIMVDYDVSDAIFHEFVTKAFMIRERGEY